MQVVVTHCLREVSSGVDESSIPDTGGNGDDLSSVAVVDHLERQSCLVWLHDRVGTRLRRRPAQSGRVGVPRGQRPACAIDLGTQLVASMGQVGRSGRGEIRCGQLVLQDEHVEFQGEPAVGQCIESSQVGGQAIVLGCTGLKFPELEICVQSFSRYVGLRRTFLCRTHGG
ncbi:hypothetical protein [Nocardia abscessus]|uniref:hypothetical protein n=1 Tax=Nocardia abscessus TaxID=120957 RepID=UPI00245845BC|nr:hypothetical protein [Nocardia abscessus]